MARIGITTTVPIEVIYAAGHVPVDLNNIFVARPDRSKLVEEAEMAGFPRNFCAWIKGIYGAVMASDDISTVVAVTQGDCSNTHGLMETLQMEGLEVIPFAYPYERDYDLLRAQMQAFIKYLGTEWERAGEAMRRLDRVREKAHEIDRLTWDDNLVSGFENHLYLVSCSDMEGDPDSFQGKLELFLDGVKARGGRAPEKAGDMVRLGYVGVPPMVPELYDYLETMGARVIYNETQRQFSLPFDTGDLVEKYRLYSYPYSIFYRLKDIEKEIERRELAGIVHYVQSFCFRQVEDIILRRSLGVPVLTIEMDHGEGLDARTRMRLETFVSVLQDRNRQ